MRARRPLPLMSWMTLGRSLPSVGLFPGALSSPLLVLGKNSRPRFVSLLGLSHAPATCSYCCHSFFGKWFQPQPRPRRPNEVSMEEQAEGPAWSKAQRCGSMEWGRVSKCQSLMALPKPCRNHVPSGYYLLAILKMFLTFLNLHLFL